MGRTGRARQDPRLAQQQAILDAAQGSAAGYADQAGGAAISQMLSFDPTDAIRTYADAQWSGAQEGLKRQLGDLAGSAAGSGRLDTGFYDQDRGEVIRNVMGDYSRGVASTALDATRMRMSNTNQLAGMGMEYAGMSADLASGAMDRRQAEITAAAEEKAAGRARKRGMWGKAAGVVGGAVFGPAGAVIGDRVAKGVAGYLR